MTSARLASFALLVGSALAGLLIGEIGLNALERPSTTSSGVLLGEELPPIVYIPIDKAPTREDRLKLAAQWAEPLEIDGRKITHGDLHGITKEDPYVGHVPLGNSVSANGWWQTNELGARSRLETTRWQSPGIRRLLLFGDSYTQGSRVPQEETFAHYLGETSGDTEVVNFGVDGYSMGQAFLRYQQIAARIEHELVFLILVPDADLWREVNVSRFVARRWEAYAINPRFVLDEGTLQHVGSPFRSLDEMLRDKRDNEGRISADHLRKYDRFFFPAMYESFPVLDRSVVFRLLRLAWAKHQYSRLMNEMYKPSGEAMAVMRAIAVSMDQVAHEAGATFALVILPSPGDTDRYLQATEYRRQWQAMAESLCAASYACYDLMEDFARRPVNQFDLGYDGTHYGPSSNRVIADLIQIRAGDLINASINPPSGE